MKKLKINNLKNCVDKNSKKYYLFINIIYTCTFKTIYFINFKSHQILLNVQ